jgi:hypothetical protein
MDEVPHAPQQPRKRFRQIDVIVNNENEWFGGDLRSRTVPITGGHLSSESVANFHYHSNLGQQSQQRV